MWCGGMYGFGGGGFLFMLLQSIIPIAIIAGLFYVGYKVLSK
ncbi:hypothetical protein [Lentilactobacillus curieae]|nr:hypothetical protein [Lentilactobacillus curieae]